MLDDLGKRRAAKRGEITPDILAANLNKAVQQGHVQTLLYITISPDGVVSTGTSSGSSLGYLGMLEVAKTQLIEEMRE